MNDLERKNVDNIRNELQMTTFSVPATARLLSTSQTTIKRLIYQHELNAVKIGGRWKVTLTSVLEYYRTHCNTNVFVAKE